MNGFDSHPGCLLPATSLAGIFHDTSSQHHPTAFSFLVFSFLDSIIGLLYIPGVGLFFELKWAYFSWEGGGSCSVSSKQGD